MLVAGLGCALVGLFAGIQPPRIHDEFSYLLSADTFLNGRVCYPTHPLWEFFETFHVIQFPIHASKFPPGQGLFLALGTLIGGHPIVGVWLSSALFCGTVFWMLRACTSWRFAATGTFLILTQFGLTSYWAQSYWGGAVAATGGALVAGALFRAMHEARPLHGALMAVGFAMLAVTRPFESVPLGLVVIVALLNQFYRTSAKGTFLAGFVVMFCMVSCSALILLGYYNYQITGSPTLLPYVIYEAQYSSTPIFPWQEATDSLVYRHQIFYDFHEWEHQFYEDQKSWCDFMNFKWQSLMEMRFFIGPSTTLPLLIAVFLFRDVYVRVALVVVSLTTLAILTLPGAQAHYFAPCVGLLYLLPVKGIEELHRLTFKGNRIGQAIVWMIILIALITFSQSLTRRIEKQPNWSYKRQAMVDELFSIEGNHLVLISYMDDHSVHHEWVYNDADIDNAKIVWARDMGPQKNRALFDYFPDHRIWRGLMP